MPKYIAQPRASHFWDGEDDYAADRLSIEVHAEGAQPHFTGVLNAQGDRLMRLPDSVPLGFHPR